MAHPDRPLDQDILNAFGLTPDQVQNYSPQQREEAVTLRTIEAQGHQTYLGATRHDALESGFLSSVNLVPSVPGFPENADWSILVGIDSYQPLSVYYRGQPLKLAYIPDAFVHVFEKRYLTKVNEDEVNRGKIEKFIVVTTDKDIERLRQRPEVQGVLERRHRVMAAFLIGFGMAALEASDTTTAVNAFDVATRGNILGNNRIFSKLKNLAETDKATAAEIIILIQRRRDQRNQATSPASS